MRYLIIAVIALSLAAGVTVPKLYRMFQITGRVPGATTETQIITQKLHVPPDGNHAEAYWVAWGNTPIEQAGGHRINMTRERWDQLHVGDPIRIIRVPGDKWPHTDDDIFVSPGNFIFDFVLLAVELIVGLAMTVKFFASRRGAAA